jgi:hypothetical protein
MQKGFKMKTYVYFSYSREFLTLKLIHEYDKYLEFKNGNVDCFTKSFCIQQKESFFFFFFIIL